LERIHNDTHSHSLNNMRFPNEVLSLALASAIAFDSTSTSAFVPTRRSSAIVSLRMDGRQQGQEQRKTPSSLDLIPELKLKSAFTQSNTLRWEMRSTLTSNEEASAASSQTEDNSLPPPQDIPEFPEMTSTGIYEILSPEQHK
jgi:hypothetical protein